METYQAGEQEELQRLTVTSVAVSANPQRDETQISSDESSLWKYLPTPDVDSRRHSPPVPDNLHDETNIHGTPFPKWYNYLDEGNLLPGSMQLNRNSDSLTTSHVNIRGRSPQSSGSLSAASGKLRSMPLKKKYPVNREKGESKNLEDFEDTLQRKNEDSMKRGHAARERSKRRKRRSPSNEGVRSFCLSPSRTSVSSVGENERIYGKHKEGERGYRGDFKGASVDANQNLPLNVKADVHKTRKNMLRKNVLTGRNKNPARSTLDARESDVEYGKEDNDMSSASASEIVGVNKPHSGIQEQNLFGRSGEGASQSQSEVFPVQSRQRRGKGLRQRRNLSPVLYSKRASTGSVATPTQIDLMHSEPLRTSYQEEPDNLAEHVGNDGASVRSYCHNNSMTESVFIEPVPIAHSSLLEGITTPSLNIKKASKRVSSENIQQNLSSDVIPKDFDDHEILTSSNRQKAETETNSPFSRQSLEKNIRENEEISGLEELANVDYDKYIASHPEFKQAVLDFEAEKKKRYEKLNKLWIQPMITKHLNKLSQGNLPQKKYPLPKPVVNRAVKKGNVKRHSVVDMFMVNGKRYDSRLARPKKWISDRLYDKVIKALEPKHGLAVRRVAEETVITMANLVTRVIKSKKSEPLLLDDLRRVLYRAGLIKDFFDYIEFSRDYFPAEFNDRGIPMLCACEKDKLPFPNDIFADLNL